MFHRMISCDRFPLRSFLLSIVVVLILAFSIVLARESSESIIYFRFRHNPRMDTRGLVFFLEGLHTFQEAASRYFSEGYTNSATERKVLLARLAEAKKSFAKAVVAGKAHNKIGRAAPYKAMAAVEAMRASVLFGKKADAESYRLLQEYQDILLAEQWSAARKSGLSPGQRGKKMAEIARDAKLWKKQYSAMMEKITERALNPGQRADLMKWRKMSSLPEPPHAPQPPDGATGVSRRISFQWRGEGGRSVYDFNLWKPGAIQKKRSKQNLKINRLKLWLALEPETVYLWRVTMKYEGISINGPVWSFRTGK